MDAEQEPTHLRGIGAFGMIPEWLLVSDISSTAKVLFAWMACKYANRSTWACWPGQARLAADLNVSANTIGAALKELISVGAVTKRKRMHASGAPATNYYQLMFLDTPEKLGIPKKTVDTYPKKTGDIYPKKTWDKPEVHEQEVHEPEVRVAPLVESPLQFHKRHGSHVSQFCDWVCLPQELAHQFATRAGLTDAEVVAWASSVRQAWQASRRVPVGGMWEWWNARWAERQTSVSAVRESHDTHAKTMADKRAKDEQRREAARAEMRRIAALKQEVWGE